MNKIYFIYLTEFKKSYNITDTVEHFDPQSGMHVEQVPAM